MIGHDNILVCLLLPCLLPFRLVSMFASNLQYLLLNFGFPKFSCISYKVFSSRNIH